MRITSFELDGSERYLTKREALRLVKRCTHKPGDKNQIVAMTEAEQRKARRMANCDSGPILPPRRPETLLLYYPHKDQTTFRPAYGF